MPTTLWRHLLIELVKMLVATTTIMVTVIAFGAAVKPLVENMIGPEALPKYIALVTIPMLQFALPFSAGFAATVVLHRFVSDNEITAMSASGMSYGKILMPVAGLGAILAAVMLFLVAYAVPQFWTRASSLLAADATQLLVAAVQRGEALYDKDKGLLIYADSVEVINSPPDSDAQKRLLLRGVAAIELGKGQSESPMTEFTAEAAAIDVYSTGAGTVAKIAMLNATVYRPGEGAIASVPYAEPEAAAFDRPFDRTPKHLAIGELVQLRNNVDLSPKVDLFKAKLAALWGEFELWKCLLTQMDKGSSFTLQQRGSNRTFAVEGARLDNGHVMPAARNGRVTVTEFVAGKATRRTQADTAVLAAVAETGFQPSLSMMVPAPIETRDLLHNASVRWPQRLDDLVPKDCALSTSATLSSDQLIELARTIPETDARVPVASIWERSQNAVKDVGVKRSFVRNESDSHLMQRAAQVVSVGLVLLLGATLAVWLRHALPLTVYLLAFLPAIANIMLIAGGQQVMKDGYWVVGAGLMWSGNAVLAASLWVVGRRLGRN